MNQTESAVAKPLGHRYNSLMDMRFSKRFTQWKPLHQGGQAKLYRVRDTWTGKVCALKIAADSDGSRAALLHEFRLLSRLRHPCLIKSLDLVWDDEGPAHVLEYVPLVPPHELWKVGGEEAVCTALIQAWRGLHYLHRQGLVHGDVSPGNILVWRDGADWRAKVADLGLVQAEEVAVLADSVRGTVDYLAPEVLRGEGSSLAADWFSLAATGVHWIDGESYFARLDPATAMRRMADFEGGLKPDRPVGEGLTRVIQGWSAAEGAKRIAFGVEALIGKGCGFGPEVTAGTVHGLDDLVASWTASILNDGVTLLSVKGRVGSGRRTGLRQVARELAANGWMDLGDAPGDVGREWVRERGGRMDAVELSRAMLEQFSGAKVVLRWPLRMSELDERVLRAFVAGREQDTVVLLAGPVEGDVPGESWLRTHLRVRDDVWVGPDDAAMQNIADDLWEGRPPEHLARRSSEEPVRKSGEFSLESASPLSLEVIKLGGRGGDDHELKAEAKAIWDRVCLGCMRALLLLSWSDEGFEPLLIEALVGEAGALELEGLLCIRSDYAAGERRLVFTDPLIKGAMARVIDEDVDEAFLSDVAALVRNQVVELVVATRFLERGTFLEQAGLGALQGALADGDYTGMLGYKKAYFAWIESGAAGGGAGGTGGGAGGTGGGGGQVSDKRFVDLFWEAARNIGRLPEEAELLRKQLRFGEDEGVRKRLVEVLSALGLWGEAKSECEALPNSDWATLKRIETLWQMGHFDEAEQGYAAVESSWQTLSNEDLLTYSVDRARIAGYQNDSEGREQKILEALSRAKNLVEHDVFFMNLYGGSLRTERNWADAIQSFKRSASTALSRQDWLGYVRARANLASTSISRGRYRDARSQIKDSLPVAIASGSGLFEARTAITGAYAEAYSGLPGMALINAQSAISFGMQLNDQGLIRTAQEIERITKISFGLHVDKKELEDNNETVLQALVSLLELEYEEARRILEKHELTPRLELDRVKYLLESNTILGNQSLALEGLEQLKDMDSGTGEAIDAVNLLTWSVTKTTDTPTALSSIRTLVDDERRFDLVYWGYYVLGSLKQLSRGAQIEFKRNYLDAIQVISQSLGDKRERFLSLPRVKQALRILAG